MEISAQYLSGIERGKENPTFDMLMNLSDGLKVEMWELFDFGSFSSCQFPFLATNASWGYLVSAGVFLVSNLA